MAIAVKVKDQMKSDIITVNLNSSLKDAAKIMVDRSIGALVVIDNSEPAGIITERDILRAFVKGEDTNKNSEVSQYMSSPLISIYENDGIGLAAQKMIIKGIRRLGVLNKNNEVVGFCNMRDLIEGIHESFLSLFEA